MDVQLYVYDLTHGMARSMSQSLLGIHLDAVYHTAIVLDNVEYFFGMGIQINSPPGTTHHGRPMEVAKLGRTELPMDVILEYLHESLGAVYTAEGYDLFARNCNHFSNDFATFLVGRGIPEHITDLPQKVLETPFGQMLRPQLEQGMRGVTQRPVPQPRDARGGMAGGEKQVKANGVDRGARKVGAVINVKNLGELDRHLVSATDSAAIVFFTSSTCAPCKMIEPAFDDLAAEYPKAAFVKVDTHFARDVAVKYEIRATPTFITTSRGTELDRWSSSDSQALKANVEGVIQRTWPSHPHTLLEVPTLQHGSLKPVAYGKVPPLEKLMGKLGDVANDKHIMTLRNFVQKRNEDAREATLPDMRSIGHAFQTRILELPLETRFAAVDLLRCAMVDHRISGLFAEEKDPQTLPAIISHVNGLDDGCPHNLRLVTLHLACNTFTSPLFVTELLRPSGNAGAAAFVSLATASLLDQTHPSTRVAAASLAFNLASANYRTRREEDREGLTEEVQLELAAGLLETLSKERGEESPEVKRLTLLALGYLAYCAREGGEVQDLMGAMDAKGCVEAVEGCEGLQAEVARLV